MRPPRDGLTMNQQVSPARAEDVAPSERTAPAIPASLLEKLFRLVPAFDALRSYSWTALRMDLIAGLTVAAVALPQAMAYATIAGLPAQYGLYTAIVMTTVGALFDSSRQLINGPTNAISIAVLSALALVPGEQKIPAAILLAFLVGAVQTGITLFRLGDLTRYISHAVIVGFTLGAAVLLVADQFKHLVGLHDAGRPGAHFLVRFWRTIFEGGPINAWAAGIGLGTIAVIIGLRWLNRRWKIRLPELLLTVVIMAFVVWLGELDHEAKMGAAAV